MAGTGQEPDSLTVRALVRQRSEALVQYVNHLGAQLDRLQNDLNTEIMVRIDEINEITRQIAKLNVTILKNEVSAIRPPITGISGIRSSTGSRSWSRWMLSRCRTARWISRWEDISLSRKASAQIFTLKNGTRREFLRGQAGRYGHCGPDKRRHTERAHGIKGEVSGTIGSHENGTPNVKTDVVFYVDTATMSIDEANDRIDAYGAELAKRGLDVQITVRDVVSADGFAAAVEGTAGDLRKDSNRYAFFLTNGTLSADQLDELGSRLAELGMDASAITDTPADWAEFAEKFDGKAYSFSDFSADTDDAAFVSLINGMAYDTDMDVSTNNSLIGDSLNIISDIKKRLNALINTMLREINYLHRSGMNIKDPPGYGEDIFVVINPARPLEMGNIRLNPNLSDLSLIAASRTGDAGDNTIALEIANLRNKAMIMDKMGLVSLDDYYQYIILTVGNRASEATNIAESQGRLVEAADAQRTAIAGVSMDEEMTHMLKFKFAYDAASRVLNIIDSMIETVVNRLGLAGR